MDLTRLERQRSELLQLLLLLIMVFLGIVAYTSLQQQQGYLIPSLTILCLAACLYVIAKERSLKSLQAQLIKEIIEKERQVKKLGQELKEEHHHLEGEKDKSLHLGLRLKELTSLYRAISIVNSVMDPKRTLDGVLHAALELTEGNCGSIMLLDEKKEHLSIVCSQGLSDRIVTQTRLKLGDGIAGWVAQNSQALLITEDIKKDERFRNLKIRDEDIRSAMSIPLQVRGQVIGAINLRITNTSQDSQKKFSELDLRVASIFAQHVSAAIENIHLLATIQKMKSSLQII